MSSDPWRDLAESLVVFCDAFEAAAAAKDRGITPGSPADLESRTESLADEWSQTPCRDATLHATFLTTPVLDHLRGLASLLTSTSFLAPATVARAAVEAAGQIVYLSEPCDARERVRRAMNERLVDLTASKGLAVVFAKHEETQPPQHGSEASAQDTVNRQAERIERILRAAKNQEFKVHRGRQPHQAPYLEERPPTMTGLAELAISTGARSKNLGTVYYKTLSAVAHSKSHGLMTHILDRIPDDPIAGTQMVRPGISATDSARNLIAAPLASVAVVESLFPHVGWDIDLVRGQIVRMLHAWGRIANVPYPGPDRF